MLYFVLMLVAAALGGVVAALITANSLWAWISIGLSALAMIVLLVDWWRRRSGGRSGGTAAAHTERSEAEAETDAAETTEQARVDDADTEAVDSQPLDSQPVDTQPVDTQPVDTQPVDTQPVDTQPVDTEAGDTEVVDTDEEPAVVAGSEQDVGASEPAEAAEEPAAKAGAPPPGEEQTDAADALIVSDLDTEVLVVDEYPRYHFGECGWLTDRETIPIAVSEARELGFSPCARCRPDAALAAEHRATRKKFGTRADT